MFASGSPGEFGSKDLIFCSLFIALQNYQEWRTFNYGNKKTPCVGREFLEQ
jgi:hypothetical protein